MSDTMVGQSLPAVTLKSSAGGSVTFPKDAQGHWTLIYFYPKDDTPGCTKQACAYRDHMADFKKLGVHLYGVSSDDLASHDSFIKKFSLNFPLLADTEKKLREGMGVTSRDTFLIDPQGKIKQVWRKVNPETTRAETYEAVAKAMAK